MPLILPQDNSLRTGGWAQISPDNPSPLLAGRIGEVERWAYVGQQAVCQIRFTGLGDNPAVLIRPEDCEALSPDATARFRYVINSIVTRSTTDVGWHGAVQRALEAKNALEDAMTAASLPTAALMDRVWVSSSLQDALEHMELLHDAAHPQSGRGSLTAAVLAELDEHYMALRANSRQLAKYETQIVA